MTQPNVPASVAARLVGRTGEYQGNEFFIKGEDFLIGRAFECHLMLNDEMISSHHARIVRTGEHYELQDLGSTNGTFVNGEKIDKKVLRTNDRIQLGGLQFEFLQPLDVSRTMVATPEAMAELAKAKAHAIPAAAPAAAQAPVEIVKIPKAAHGHPTIGLIPGVLMGLLFAYVLPLLAAAFQMKKAGGLSVSALIEFAKNWARIFPGLYTHEGIKLFTSGTWTGILVIVGLALGPIVGGFLAARLGRRSAPVAALDFTIFYVIAAVIIQIARMKFEVSQMTLWYPQLLASLGNWGSVAATLAYFAGVVFILALLGALLGRKR
jgi:hypothetical protein